MTNSKPAASDAFPDQEVISSGETSQSATRTQTPVSEQFDAFYRRELPRLVAFANALCGRAVADDLAQEAMIAAYRRWGEVAGFASPEAWVRRVCANMATSVLRRRAAEARALLRLGSRPTPQTLEPENQTFWAEVRKLPKRQSQVVALRYVYDLSLAQIAETLSCSEGSVKVHLNRARTKLATRFELETGRVVMNLDQLGTTASAQLIEQTTSRTDIDSWRQDLDATVRRRRRNRLASATVCLVVIAFLVVTMWVPGGDRAEPAKPAPAPTRLTHNGVIAVQTRSGWVTVDPETGTVEHASVDHPPTTGLTAAQFSPDGRQLAYTWHGSGYIHPMDGGRDYVAIRPFSDTSPFAEQLARIVWTPHNKDYRVQLPPKEAGFLEWASWSPDGTQVSYIPAGGHLTVMDADGSNAHRLPAEPGKKDIAGWVSWSPDGSTLAYLEADSPGAGGNAFVMTIDPTGENRRVIGSAGTAADTKSIGGVLAWAPDSTSVAFFGYDVGGDKEWGLYVMTLDGQIKRLPVPGLRGDATAWQPVA